MSLTADDLHQIRTIVHEIVTDEVSGSEARLHQQIVTLGDRLDARIDETHTRIDALRIEVTRDIDHLARTVATLTPGQANG
ncbi:MAG TPA: hypothetical protein VI322_03030 [Candidatus Saccharimonadia bacterium]